MGARLDGMIFVITGAAQGIGAATARMAAARGASVVVADVDDAAGERTAAGHRRRRWPGPLPALRRHRRRPGAGVDAGGGRDVRGDRRPAQQRRDPRDDAGRPAVDRGDAGGGVGPRRRREPARGLAVREVRRAVPEAQPARAVDHQRRLHRVVGRRRVEPRVRRQQGRRRAAHQEPGGGVGPVRHPGQLLLPERDRDPHGRRLPGRGGRPRGPAAHARGHPTRRPDRPTGRHRQPGLLPGQRRRRRTSTGRCG